MASDAITEVEGDDATDSVATAGHLGRYRVDGVLGRGGMGVVLAAYDPELERRVALKLLRRAEADGQDALLAEAQAMARVRHANVVTVFDVGVVDERVFVAMELVTGPTLRAWRSSTARSWRAIVAHYAAAGRGLAAAHAVDVIHRDFKPDNVLVGDDGVVRVADFGLAGADHARGAVVGTPVYMAPEQHAGVTLDARADQYAFAVALWEALTGAAPFVGDTISTLHAAKRDQRLPAPRGPAPRWTFAILRRALAVDPAARWPSMTALVAALERGLGRRRMLVIGGGALAVVAATAVSVRVLSATPAAGPDCRRAGDAVRAAWPAVARDRVIAALGAVARPYAATTATLTATALDRRAAALVDARIATCAATHERGERSALALDRAMACFDRQQGQLAALGVLLGGSPDAEMLDRAVDAVDALPLPLACTDASATRRPPTAPAMQAAVAALEARAADADALRVAGKLPLARAAYDALVIDAAALGDPGVLADIRSGHARTLGELGDAAAGKDAFRAAATAASGIGDDRGIAAAWLGELELLSVAGGAPLEALDRLPFATIAVERSGDALLREDLDVVRGKLLLEQGDATAAQAAFEAARTSALARGVGGSLAAVRIDQQLTRALFARDAIDEAIVLGRATVAAYQRLLGDDHLTVAKAINNLGIAVDQAGRFDDAIALHQQALAIKERVLGPDDPSVATTLHNLGLVASHQERGPEAIAYYQRALVIRERALGPDHKLVASTLSNLAVEHGAQGRLGDAAAEFERAIAIRERAEGPDSPGVAAPLLGLANVLRDGGAVRDARAPALRALAIRERALGVDSPQVAEVVITIADLDAAQGDRAAACRGYTRAVDIVRAQRGGDHPQQIVPLANLAECRRVDGRLADAIAMAEDVVRIVDGAGIEGFAAAGARLVLAQALWTDTATRPRARAEAERALADCAAASSERSLECEQVKRWRAAH